MSHAGASVTWTLKSIKNEVEGLMKAQIDTDSKYPRDLILALALVHREIGAFLGTAPALTAAPAEAQDMGAVEKSLRELGLVDAMPGTHQHVVAQYIAGLVASLEAGQAPAEGLIPGAVSMDAGESLAGGVVAP